MKKYRPCFRKRGLLRWDSDAVQADNSHHDILNKFRNYEADFLIGTQMVAKGLDYRSLHW